jgi:hypothetical protein
MRRLYAIPTYVELCLKASYAALDDIDVRLNQPTSDEELAGLLDTRDAFELKISRLWVTSSMRARYYDLRQALEVVRAKAKAGLVHASQPGGPH